MRPFVKRQLLNKNHDIKSLSLLGLQICVSCGLSHKKYYKHIEIRNISHKNVSQINSDHNY